MIHLVTIVKDSFIPDGFFVHCVSLIVFREENIALLTGKAEKLVYQIRHVLALKG